MEEKIDVDKVIINSAEMRLTVRRISSTTHNSIFVFLVRFYKFFGYL